ncbi:MAG: hypothetical protein ACI37Q_05275 [Candidatus Gastranaerophilaceae bacterium]
MTENQGYSAFIPQLWSKKLNQMLEKNCVMMQCVNRNWEGEIRNQGDTVKIITPAEVTVSTLTSDNIEYSTLNPKSTDLVIDQKKFFAFKIDDVSSVQANADIMEAHLANAKKAIEEVQDSYLLGLHTDVLAENIVGSEDLPVVLNKGTIYEQFVNLALALKNSDAVYAGVRPWVIINPTIESYLLQSPEFISAYNVADKTLREGAIGRIAGMDVLVSTNLTDVDNKYYVLAGTNDAITFASQLAKIESLRDKDSFSDLVRGLYLYGAKTVQPKALAKMIVSVNGVVAGDETVTTPDNEEDTTPEDAETQITEDETV